MFDKLVDFIYKHEKQKLVDIIRGSCPSDIGLEDNGDCPFKDGYLRCEKCWEKSLSDSKYTDFVKF